MRKNTLLCVLLGIVLLAGLAWRHRSPSSAPRQASEPSIEKQPAVLAMHTFDPAAPPADMPPLSAGEEAECDSNFVSNASVQGRSERIDAMHAVVTVTDVKMTLGLEINVWVPEGATLQVVEHEQGHRQISECYYQTAEKVARRIAAAYIGRQVSISGADLDGEASKSLQQMGAAITAEYNDQLNPGPAQQRYDEITDHSRNEVAASEAVARARKEVQ